MIQGAPCIFGTACAASFSKTQGTALKFRQAASAAAGVCSATDRVGLLQYSFLKLIFGNVNSLEFSSSFPVQG